MSFREFNKEEIERCKEKYAQEAEERWGGTQAYKESKSGPTAMARLNGRN